MSKPNLKANMRSGLGGGFKVEPSVRRDSPLEPTISRPVVAVPDVESSAAPQVNIAPDESPLVKQNMVLTLEQYEALKALAAKVQWNGQKHPERITSNTVLRCLVSLLDHFEGDLSQIKTEDDLKHMIRAKFLK